MKTIYHATSKNGRESEGEFTTRALAEGAINSNDYYCPRIVEEEVSELEYNDLKLSERSK